MEYLNSPALDNQADQDLDQQKHSAGSSKTDLCFMVILLKNQSKECITIGGGKSWVCWTVVYFGVQEWLFHHQEESE